MSIDPRLVAVVEGRKYDPDSDEAKSQKRVQDAVLAGKIHEQESSGAKVGFARGHGDGKIKESNAPEKSEESTDEAIQRPGSSTAHLGPIPISERTNEVIYIGKTQTVRESIPKFYCFKAKFPELTYAVTRCYNMMSLRVIKSGLEILPDAIGDLARHGVLRELSLDFNKLSRIPESISRLTTLERLSVSHNQLRALPMSLGRLSRCNMLNVAHNEIRDLPESTRNLSALNELFLQSNELRSLPSHGDPGGPGDFPPGAGPNALSSRQSALKSRAAQRSLEEFRVKIVASKSPREIIYWFGRIKEEYDRGALDCISLDWLDSVAAKLGRHQEQDTTEQTEAKMKIEDNIKMLRAAKGMKAEGLKKELRKRKLDSSYSGSNKELYLRLEKHVKADNKKNALIIRGIWLADVEKAFVSVLGIVSPHDVVTLRIVPWRANGLRNADGKYSMSDPYMRCVMRVPFEKEDRELGRSETLRNTLDPEWYDVEGISYNLDRRVDLSRQGVLLRIEVWDWDFGGDDADDLLGQISFRGEEVAALLDMSRLINEEAAEDEAKKYESKALTKQEDMPQFVRTYKLEIQAEDHDREDLTKSIRKKASRDNKRASRVTGTVDVGIRVEISKASANAAMLAKSEAEAKATAFEMWPKLKVANMSHNRIQSLPRSCRGWKLVTRLNLSGNLISELPDEMCSCSMIEDLNLADNQLTSLPDNFGHLSKLTALRLDRNKLSVIPESTYHITTLRQLNLAENPLKPIDGIKLWRHGDPILRFKDTAAKLLEVEPTPVRRMEPGTRIFDTTLYTRKIRTDGGAEVTARKKNGAPGPPGQVEPRSKFDSILCADFFSVTGCRYGDYCMFSHVPEPLPVVPFQRTKEAMSKDDLKTGKTSHNKEKVHFYGITHEEYDELWKILEEDGEDADNEGSSSDEN